MTVVEDADSLRCAVHPGSPSYDTCPVCSRPRCAADAELAPGGGCLACEGARPRKGPPPLDLRALAGAGVVCGLAAPLAGLISSEYVGAGFVGYIVPFFVGIVMGIAAEAGARVKRGRALRILAAFYAVLAVATGLDHPLALGNAFALEPDWWITPIPRTLVLYAGAAAGAWVWTAPPRVVPKKPD